MVFGELNGSRAFLQVESASIIYGYELALLIKLRARSIKLRKIVLRD